jgi:hypothetical protein
MGVFRSTDRAASWTALNDGLTNLFVQTLAIDPRQPSTLYAGTYGGSVFALPLAAPTSRSAPRILSPR